MRLMLSHLKWQHDMKENACLDARRTAWKVLVPFASAAKILAMGFGGVELDSLSRCFQNIDTSPSKDSYDMLVLGEELNGNAAINGLIAKMKQGGLLVALNIKKDYKEIVNKELKCVGEYACLPSRCPRIILPLGSKGMRKYGLSFHSPGSFKKKISLWLAQGLSAIGVTAHLRKKTVSFYTHNGQLNRQGTIKEWISQRAGFPIDDVVIYTGSDSPASKTTLLGLSSDCQHKIVARVAETDIAVASLHREVKALKELASTPLSDFVPTLIDIGKLPPYEIQLQSCLPKSNGQYPKLSAAHIRFLSILSEINREDIPFCQLRAWGNVDYALKSSGHNSLPASLQKVITWLQGRDIQEIVTCHMIHGDFAPWNIIYRDKSIYVYDWEDSVPNGVPFEDLFHFIYRQASLVGPWPGAVPLFEIMINAARTLNQKTAIKFNLNAAFALWCLGEYRKNPTPLLLELIGEFARKIDEEST